MFSLYFEITFTESHDSSALRFCDDLALPLAAAHTGFVSGLVLKPVGSTRALRLLTVWNDQAAAESFQTSASFQELASSMAGFGLALAGDEIHDVHRWDFAQAGEVRYIRTSVPPERLDEVALFWQQRGRHVIESATGCVRAQGFIDREASEFVLVIWWQSAEDAEAFRLSDYHEREFVEPLGEDVVRLNRTHLEPLESRKFADSRR